ncbi:MAG: hypothetical protein P9M14_16770 [Candidatus Alcyoniella australis]|nr:hypothetical protein [Candidatus Alcyoniella australis]
MALTVIHIDNRKMLCSALDQGELSRLYQRVKHSGVLDRAKPSDDSDLLQLGLQPVGPLRIDLGKTVLILWGSGRELRFYTPEEYNVLTGQDED